jgi:hypothetical protein
MHSQSPVLDPTLNFSFTSAGKTNHLGEFHTHIIHQPKYQKGIDNGQGDE